MHLFNHPLRVTGSILAGLLFFGGMSIANPVPAEAVPVKPQIYKVQSGDSIYRIAQNHASTTTEIKTVNSITGDWIIPGEMLIIPSPGYGNYVVKPGDSLYFIAQKYHTTVTAIQRINNLGSTNLMPGQTLFVPEQAELLAAGQSLSGYLAARNRTSLNNIQIVIHKNAHTLSIYDGDTLLKTYPVSLGDGGLDPKQVSGDHKTPEGYFYVVEKSVLNPKDAYLGSRWMRLGYPNSGDAVRGVQQSLIGNPEYQSIINAFNQKRTPPQGTRLGGGIGIHGGTGGGNTGDWTWGCVGLYDADIEDFYNYTQVGSPVIIVK